MKDAMIAASGANVSAIEQSTPLPVVYEEAKRALATCSKVDECQQWADKSAALRSYAKQADDTTLMNHAQRIQARAIRRAGELLKEVQSGRGNNQHGAVTHTTRTSAAKDAGLSKHQQVQAVRVASVPATDFERQVESDNPPTVTALAEQGKKRQAVDLKGRSPSEYNQAMHFEAMFMGYAKEIERWDAERVSCFLTPEEKAIVRQCIDKIDAFHSTVKSRI